MRFLDYLEIPIRLLLIRPVDVVFVSEYIRYCNDRSLEINPGHYPKAALIENGINPFDTSVCLLIGLFDVLKMLPFGSSNDRRPRIEAFSGCWMLDGKRFEKMTAY